MSEQWLPVAGFEGLYSVSDQGRIWSHRMNRAMKGTPDKDGYLMVPLNKGKPIRAVTAKVHRLVAQAFIPNPLNLPEVDHRFGTNDDNRATQLRWATVSLNRSNKHRTSSASGVVGVCYRPEKKNPWQAYCTQGGRMKSLGHFPTKHEATQAREQHVRAC